MVDAGAEEDEDEESVEALLVDSEAAGFASLDAAGFESAGLFSDELLAAFGA